MKFLLTLLGLVGLFTTLASATPMLSTPRDVSDKVSPTTCTWNTGQKWGVSPDFDAGIAIEDLKKRGGSCGVNGRTCVQIACHGAAELVLCNDNNYYIEPNANYLASYAEDIVHDCRYFYAPSFMWYVGGQKFDTDHYNVIVKQPERRCGS